MPKIVIKERHTGTIRFECELPAEAAGKSREKQLGYAIQQAFAAGAILTGADLRSADLTGADLFSANLTGADLRSADLTDVIL